MNGVEYGQALNKGTNMFFRRPSVFVVIAILTWMPCDKTRAEADDFHFFEKHIRPLLASRCLKCHSAASEEIGGDLLLDTRSGWMQGGQLGPAVTPGAPKESLLIQAVQYANDELQMPPCCLR